MLKQPPFPPVQLATLVDRVPSGERWVHEMKYDGYRTLLAIGGGEAKAYSRSGLDWSERFGALLSEAATLDVGAALIDGEAVVLDTGGRSSFQALKSNPGAIVYYAFDLLSLDGEDLTPLALLERKEELRAPIREGLQRIRYSEHIQGSGERLLDTFCAAGLEALRTSPATRHR